VRKCTSPFSRRVRGFVRIQDPTGVSIQRNTLTLGGRRGAASRLSTQFETISNNSAGKLFALRAGAPVFEPGIATLNQATARPVITLRVRSARGVGREVVGAARLFEKFEDSAKASLEDNTRAGTLWTLLRDKETT